MLLFPRGVFVTSFCTPSTQFLSDSVPNLLSDPGVKPVSENPHVGCVGCLDEAAFEGVELARL